jgi:uncharacterized protein (TIGR02217 family)
MSNAVLPMLRGMSFPVEKTAVWKTKTQTHVSGKETRLNLWSYPLWQWSLSYDVLRSDAVNAELQSLVGFFNARQGSYDSWLFNDPDDNVISAQAFGVGDGTTRAFQLSRTFGGWNEPVTAINAITQVTVNGTPTSAYTLSQFTGLLTFTTAPAASAVLAWTGSYYWRVRFMDDQTTVSKFMTSLWENQGITFQSIK